MLPLPSSLPCFAHTKLKLGAFCLVCWQSQGFSYCHMPKYRGIIPALPVPYQGLLLAPTGASLPLE